MKKLTQILSYILVATLASTATLFASQYVWKQRQISKLDQLSDLIEANREKKRITGREFMTSGGEMDFELPNDGLDEE